MIQRFVNSRLIPSSPKCLQVSRNRFAATSGGSLKANDAVGDEELK
jgi:hypothetical protein